MTDKQTKMIVEAIEVAADRIADAIGGRDVPRPPDNPDGTSHVYLPPPEPTESE